MMLCHGACIRYQFNLRPAEPQRHADTGKIRAVVSEASHYCTHSQSEPGTVYQVVRTPAGWACSCLGFFHTGCCKHLGQVERRAERDGWAFGRIAPLSRVAKYFPLDAA